MFHSNHISLFYDLQNQVVVLHYHDIKIYIYLAKQVDNNHPANLLIHHIHDNFEIYQLHIDKVLFLILHENQYLLELIDMVHVLYKYLYLHQHIRNFYHVHIDLIYNHIYRYNYLFHNQYDDDMYYHLVQNSFLAINILMLFRHEDHQY